MIRYSHTSWVKQTPILYFTCDDGAAALEFADCCGGITERIHNGTKHVWRIMI